MIIPFPLLQRPESGSVLAYRTLPGTFKLPASYNYQMTIDFQDELRAKLGRDRYSRISFVWVGLTGERFVSWDRIHDTGQSITFSASANLSEIVSQLVSLLG